MSCTFFYTHYWSHVIHQWQAGDFIPEALDGRIILIIFFKTNVLLYVASSIQLR
jgi:hypothetical protein